MVEVIDQEQLQRWTGIISNVLENYDLRGFSLRVPWDAMSDALLDQGKAIADDAGKAYSIRVWRRFASAAGLRLGAAELHRER